MERSLSNELSRRNVEMKTKNKKQLTLLLAALTLAAPQIGALSPSLQNTPLGLATTEAQTYRRGRDYRDSDLNRLAWITQRGVVTSNPTEDYLEMRAENGQTFRIVTRNNVSLRNIKRNDYIQVYGKRDGQILIAYNVKEIGGSSNNRNWNNNERTLQGVVTSLSESNRFSLRLNDGRNVNVISDDRTPTFFSRGDTLVVTGRWNNSGRWNENSLFRADNVRVVGNSNSNNNERTLQGTVLSDNDIRRFTMRTNDRREVTVVSNERTSRRLSRGDVVVVEGRWDWNQLGTRHDNVFRATSVRIIRDNAGNNNNGTKVDFRGTIMRATQNRNNWEYVVRTNGRDYLVTSRERFRINDRVRVRGVLVNGRIVASDIDRY
jgi:translation initiation factor IF-1